MPKTTYDILLQKYNTLIAKAKDLQEQVKDKTNQLAERESQHNVTVDLMRELCEMILPNDRSEMKLGVDYSWSSIEINELIRKTKAVYTAYTKDTKEKLQKLLDTNEERGQLIESLEDQLEFARRNNVEIDREELAQKVEKQKELDSLKTTLDKGTVFKNTDHQQLMINTDESDAIEGAEMDAYEAAIAMDADMQSQYFQVNESSPKIKEDNARKEKKKKVKEKISSSFYADVSKYEEDLDDIHWNIINAIGKKGLSRFQQIEQEVLNDDSVKAHQVRIHIKNLQSSKIVEAENVPTPWGRQYVYWLSELGERIFKRKHNEEPVTAEANIVRAEHDNCEHGYGIVMTAEMLRKDGFFKEVKEYNRKNPIEITKGSSYVPDIICERKNGGNMYIEYECANHTQADFDAKCNKMSKVTGVLNFMTPNKKTEEAICTQVSKWIQNKGAKNMGHITIRVTTAKFAEGVDLNKDENWRSVFSPHRSGKTPTTNM